MRKLLLLSIAFTGLIICLNTFANAQGLSINPSGSNPDPSAGLDVNFTNKGTLITRMTTTQRDAIASPAEALLIYNLTTKCLEIYEYGVWQTIHCGVCPSPVAPVAGSHTASQTQVVWNWNTVAGATGYKWNTTSNYATATNNSNSTSYTQTGLSCGTAYTLYVWAYNSCNGNSSPVTLTQTTSACPFSCGTSTVTFTYRGSTVTYGTVHGGYSSGSYCWLDRNLGATQVATSSADANAYGDLIQWGRADDGHQSRTSSTTAGPTTNPTPGNNFITTNTSPFSWYNGTSPLPDGFWQGVNGINNPCPSGFRLPTGTELTNEMSAFSTQNAAGAFASPLKLPVAGYRDYSSAAVGDAGSRAYYWSSTVYSGQYWANLLLLGPTFANMANFNQFGYGHSVRCIKD